MGHLIIEMQCVAGQSALGCLTFTRVQARTIDPLDKKIGDLMIAIKSRAEDRVDSIKRRQQRTLDETARADSDRAEHVARLRSQRLAKEAAETAEESNGAVGGQGGEPTPVFPVPHRR